MRKHVFGRKLNRTTNERKQLRRNLVRAIVRHSAIITTLAKAKMVQPYLEKLVTTAKKNTLNSLRNLNREIGDIETARKLSEYGKLFVTRQGGYTRIIKLGFSQGDNSQKVQLTWVEQLVVAEEVQPVTKIEKVSTDKQVASTSAVKQLKEVKKPKKVATKLTKTTKPMKKKKTV